MKRIAIAGSVAALVIAVGVQAQTPAHTRSESVEQELLKLEKEWGDALVKPDLAFLDRIQADDFTFTDPEGFVWTKAQSLALLKSGEDVIWSLVSDDMEVRVYGDTAVVTGRNTVKETFKGKDISGQYRWTDTWLKKAGGWQCVVSHSSRITLKFGISERIKI
jgi:ketosteroid isomerase-like protein